MDIRKSNWVVPVLLAGVTALFIVPLMVCRVPLQADDFFYYIKIILNREPMPELYEFRRLPLQGMVLFFNYKLAAALTPDLSVNGVLIFYALLHGVSAWLLYRIVLEYLKEPVTSVMSALLFLCCPIATESYANLSFVARNAGLPLLLLAFWWKLRWFQKPDSGNYWFRAMGTGLVTLAGLSFYESYVIYVGFGWLLLAVAVDRQRGGRYLLLETGVIVAVVLLKFVLFLNNVHDRGVSLEFGHCFRQLLVYGMIVTVPNLNGTLFYGSFLFSPALILLLVLGVAGWRRDRSDWQLGVCLGCFLLGALGLLSLNRYLIPRALYGLQPFLAFLMALLARRITCRGLRTVVVSLMLLGGTAGLWQFFLMQQQAYDLVKQVETRASEALATGDPGDYVIAVRHYDRFSGVRVFQEGHLELLLMKLIQQRSGRSGEVPRLRIVAPADATILNNSIFQLIRAKLEASFRPTIPQVDLVRREGGLDRP